MGFYNLCIFCGEILPALTGNQTLPVAGCQLLKKAHLTTDEHDDADLQIQMAYLNFFDPCKSALSVLSVVRFGFLCKALNRNAKIAKELQFRILSYFAYFASFAVKAFSSYQQLAARSFFFQQDCLPLYTPTISSQTSAFLHHAMAWHHHGNRI